MASARRRGGWESRSLKIEKPGWAGLRRGCQVGSAYGIRTRVTGVRGRRPGPLDECATCPTSTSIGPAKGTTDIPGRSTSPRETLFRYPWRPGVHYDL